MKHLVDCQFEILKKPKRALHFNINFGSWLAGIVQVKDACGRLQSTRDVKDSRFSSA